MKNIKASLGTQPKSASSPSPFCPSTHLSGMQHPGTQSMTSGALCTSDGLKW